MTEGEWDGHEYQQWRRRRGCPWKASFVAAALVAVITLLGRHASTPSTRKTMRHAH